MTNFDPFPKIGRLHRDIVITEKIDGTNAQVYIDDFSNEQTLFYDELRSKGVTIGNLTVIAGSRKRYIVPGDDNFGFAKWVWDNAAELVELGPGRHFGEWWGPGIQRGYGLLQKRFSLFNVGRWISAHSDEQSLCTPALDNPNAQVAPRVCHVVPTLYKGPWFIESLWNQGKYAPDAMIQMLRDQGSHAAPLFKGEAEGIIVWHSATGTSFKQTLRNDEKPKGQV